MMVKVKSVLLIFFSFKVLCCEGCWKQESEALLGLNSRLGYPLFWIDGTDCCHWEGVECNKTTRRVASLNLNGRRDYYPHGQWYLNYSDFTVFNDLKTLNLSFTNTAGCAKSEGLENLQVLDLSYNILNNAASVQSCLDGLSSIKSLYLSFNGFNATSFHVFETLSSKLLNLEVLDISANYLTNEILPSLGGFTSLKKLDLSQIGLNSDLHIQGLWSKLMNLEVLDMSNNNFNDSDIGTALSGFLSLSSVNLKYSQMTPRSILNISKLRSLEVLDLGLNELDESILWSLENDGFAWPTGLKVLGLSSNSFSNNFLSSLWGIGSLESLDLSSNNLEGSLNISGLSALINLQILDLSGNQISHFVVHQGSKSLSRLDVLALDNNMINGSMLRKSLWAFSSIRVLSLTNNEFEGTMVAEDFSDLSKLEHLALDHSSNLENEFFKSVGELTSLKVLSLSECGINGTLPAADWSKLKKLEELDITFNKFVGPLPLSFFNMTSLLKLDLSHNHFTGNFSSNLASLTSLEYFGFTENQFEVPISFTPFANHSNLKFIYGEGNRVILDSKPTFQTWIPKFQLQVLSLSSTTITDSLPLPKFLLYQYNLTTLDFTSCKLDGEFPNWLFKNNTKMSEFIVRNCSFTGTFKPPLHPLPSMRRIDVSDNVITGQIPSKNISSIFPNLRFLNMSINEIQGSISHEFGQMKLLDTLDLSDNYLSGEIPKNISWDRSSLRFLRLSNNKLNGPVFPTLSALKHLEQLYLDGNSFSGSIPSGFSNTSLLALDISNNHFVGKLPNVVGNLTNLVALSMSNNHLEGSMPAGLVELESLVYLDISQNDFTGLVPSFVNSSVRSIHLSNNRLSGLSKRMFSESSSIWILDLRYNQITSNIHSLVQDLSFTVLNFLLLKGNHFSGQIPKQICQLVGLTILDLSHNNFSGSIPTCLGTIPFKNDYPLQSQMIYGGFYSRSKDSLPYVQEKANFTTKKRSYTYTGNILAYMSGIDLSHNKLTGNIPSELGNLTKIRALNLSHNSLTGKIPATFSGLVQVESLDLSFNKLSSKIPSQLNELNSLAVFSVAHNNLSGETPERKGQFITFDESSYEGNPFLCGPPLSKSCHPERTTPVILPNGSYSDRDSGGLMDMYDFFVSFGVSYTLVLLVIGAILYINPYWRGAWFYYVELVSTNSYYFIEDNLRKLSNRGNT
ncbi:cuscuta receptor 1-like isoform X2 [Lotus japonicus]|uniref:cuscuta receptor 1-like isoform X2 n=1 Tax=Lotus japonicus TaxID=34305 RepID=UPI0025878E9D|nr:cuscuta receptor 1-like isoform X2 [Lotus japonicus]